MKVKEVYKIDYQSSVPLQVKDVQEIVSLSKTNSHEGQQRQEKVGKGKPKNHKIATKNQRLCTDF